MAKNSFNELWIDGFNLFHKWSRTKNNFRRGTTSDISDAQQDGIRQLAQALGKKRSRSILFMDGGVEQASMTLHGLRIRYPGSGKKADTLMEEFARGRTSNKRILAVTSDRALGATLKRNRIQIIDSEKFIREYLTSSNNTHAYTESKPEVSSPEEVEEWLKLFEDDE